MTLSKPASRTSFAPGAEASVTVWPSNAGNVFGMMSTFVYPPDAEARQPETIDSLYVWPGSRKWTCGSSNPGAKVRPVASMSAPSTTEEVSAK